jgi:hypothetical protein
MALRNLQAIPLASLLIVALHGCGVGAVVDEPNPQIDDGLTTAPKVVSVSLVNAGTGQPIAGFDPLAAGATLVLANLPTQALSIRANMSPSSGGSVKFALDGASHVENAAPYSLCGDQTTRYTACPALDVVGAHTLSVTPYSGQNSSGAAGATVTVPFNVQKTASAGPSVVSVSLIDAATGQPIAGFNPIANGATIHLGSLPTQQLSIRASTSPSAIGSVHFALDSSFSHDENSAPYELCGDNTACPELNVARTHTLSATAYSGAARSGVAGSPFTITFATEGGASTTGTTSYTTNFGLTENPISEGGRWIAGQSAGGNLWGDVRTKPGLAYGVSQPTGYGDPTALVTGNWGPNQTVQGTVKIDGYVPTTNYCCREIELRLRQTIAPGRITGYEVFCSVVSGAPYCAVASWGGPNGVYAILQGSAASQATYKVYMRDGDVLKATVTGTNPVVITVYLNGAQVWQGEDTGNETFTDGKKYGPWTSGNPGIGFYGITGVGTVGGHDDWSAFGWSSFSASSSP